MAQTPPSKDRPPGKEKSPGKSVLTPEQVGQLARLIQMYQKDNEDNDIPSPQKMFQYLREVQIRYLFLLWSYFSREFLPWVEKSLKCCASGNKLKIFQVVRSGNFFFFILWLISKRPNITFISVIICTAPVTSFDSTMKNTVSWKGTGVCAHSWLTRHIYWNKILCFLD